MINSEFIPNIRSGYVNIEKFWAKVDRRLGDNACWPWIGKRRIGQYGSVLVRVRSERGIAWRWEIASRIAYELTYGDLAPTDKVRHSCDTPECCRPDHLGKGTQQDNANDMMRRRRHPLCVNASLSMDDVVLIRHQYADGTQIAALAKKFGVGYQHIWRIVTGISWKIFPGPIAVRRRTWNKAWKLSPEQVAAIRHSYANGSTQQALAIAYGVSTSWISNVVRGRRKDSIGPLVSDEETRHRKGLARYRSAKLTEDNVVEIRKQRTAGTSLAILAKRYSVTPATICSVQHRKTWRHVQ